MDITQQLEQLAERLAQNRLYEPEVVELCRNAARVIRQLGEPATLCIRISHKVLFTEVQRLERVLKHDYGIDYGGESEVGSWGAAPAQPGE